VHLEKGCATRGGKVFSVISSMMSFREKYEVRKASSVSTSREGSHLGASGV